MKIPLMLIFQIFDMSKLDKLLEQCESMNLNCSFTYQRSNDYSVEIYTGYISNYNQLFFTDGHINPKHAAKKGLKFLKDYELDDIK